MTNADATFCQYNYNNLPSDAFVCSDIFIDSNRNRGYNETQDVYSFVTNVASGIFKVSFVRPLYPTDVAIGKDFPLKVGSNNIIYAFGYLA